MVTAAAALAKVASTERLRQSFADRTETADDLLDAAEAPIAHWLATKAAKVVLPPDAEEPRAEVLHDAWLIDGVRHELTITAWDECGMVPFEFARAGSPLRAVLSPEARRVVDRAAIGHNEKPGLDLIPPVNGLAVFPAPVPAEPAWFGDSPTGRTADARSGRARACPRRLRGDAQSRMRQREHGADEARRGGASPGGARRGRSDPPGENGGQASLGRGRWAPPPGVHEIGDPRDEHRLGLPHRGGRGTPDAVVVGRVCAEPGSEDLSSMGVRAAPCDHRVIQLAG